MSSRRIPRDPTDVVVAEALRALVLPTGRPEADAYDDVLRFQTRPGRVLVRRLREARDARAKEAHARTILRRMADQLVDVVWAEPLDRQVPICVTREAA